MSEKTKRGRPPKSLNLDPLKDTQRGVELPAVRSPVTKQEKPVLPDTPSAQAPRNETVRIFAKPEAANSQRAGQPSEIPASVDTDIRLSHLIRKILAEPAADEYQDQDGLQMSNAEKIARILIDRALKENQFAIEAVLDRAEGKPVKGQNIYVPDLTVEEMISAQEVALLNNAAKKESK